MPQSHAHDHPAPLAEVNLGVASNGSLMPDPWETAYLRFETPEEEIRKFIGRLKRLGAGQWPRDAEIVELFCGRGNGLIALQRLGFTRVEGVDLSPRLIAQFEGSAKCTVGDCRKLLFANCSKDILIVQGGLHHLPLLPSDLEQTFDEMHRVLRKGGHVMFVEPWRTPFLDLAHFVSGFSLVRRISKKMDAFATMYEHEIRTYTQWLGNPGMIRTLAQKYFVPAHESFAWGKWNFVGSPR